MSRESRLVRRPPRREARQRLLIVCGSERTEPQYLAGLRDFIENRAVDLRIVKHPRSPAQVVTYAAKITTADFDEVWCVVDVDEFDLASAAAKASRERIELAVSNPCFEVWLLLHHEDCRAAMADCHAVLVRLRKHLPAYDKTKLDFLDYVKNVADAVTRARALETSGTDHTRNPSTSMWRLVEKIMG
jgi:hypothetical protein